MRAVETVKMHCTSKTVIKGTISVHRLNWHSRTSFQLSFFVPRYVRTFLLPREKTSCRLGRISACRNSTDQSILATSLCASNSEQKRFYLLRKQWNLSIRSPGHILDNSCSCSREPTLMYLLLVGELLWPFNTGYNFHRR